MLAAAGERPPSVDSPAVGGRLGGTSGLGRPGEHRVRAVPVDLIVRLAAATARRGSPAADRHRPADRTVDLGECSQDLERRRQIEL